MTLAIAVQTTQGIVLATDSLMIISDTDGRIARYCGQQKLFQLNATVGVAVYGASEIGAASVSVLLRELANELPWNADAAHVAQTIKTQIFDKHYVEATAHRPQQNRPTLGFIIAGYSTNAFTPDLFVVEVRDGQPCEPENRGNASLTIKGCTEPTSRLIFGQGESFPKVVAASAHNPEDVLDCAKEVMFTPMAAPEMPLLNAVDLASYLYETTEGYYRFAFVPDNGAVEGPLQLATVTKHDGFMMLG